jgi:hypothetical protein
MKDLPLDQTAINPVFVAAVPHTREGAAVTNRDGQPLTNVSCVVLPTEAGGKVETMEVRVPSESVPKQLQPFQPVQFDRLIARAWAVDGRSGISFSANAVRQGGTPAKAAG